MSGRRDCSAMSPVVGIGLFLQLALPSCGSEPFFCVNRLVVFFYEMTRVSEQMGWGETQADRAGRAEERVSVSV